MKKLIFAYMVYACIPFFVYGNGGAQKPAENETSAIETPVDDVPEEIGESDEKKAKTSAFLRGEGAALSTGKLESRRYFELGLLDLSLSVTGMDVMGLMNGSLFDFDGIDTEKLDSFTANMELFTNPLYFRISVNNTFNLDFFTGAESKLYVNIPQETIDAMTSIKKIAETVADPMNIPNLNFNIDAGMSAGVSAFAEIGVGGSKTLLNDRLWVRAAPSLFFTLLYMPHSSIKLTSYTNRADYEIGLRGGGSMKMYSAWDMDSAVNPFASPGVDFALEARYALWSVLDTGLSVSHIPLIPSTLTHSKSINAEKITMTVSADPKKILTDPENVVKLNVPELDDMYEGSGDENKTVMRPVRFDFYAFYKPFKSPVFIIEPHIGATVNDIAAYTTPNWALNFQYNAPIIFSAFIGTGLTEGIWANRAGLSLDFRAFEVGIGAAITGTTFADSFSFKQGMMVTLGFKFGF